jgi:hypothetical protein
MTDDVRKVLEMVPHGYKADHAQLWAHLRILATHIDGEPLRLAAAREEQREACARRFWDTVAAEKARSAPLTATPLADEIAALRARVAEIQTSWDIDVKHLHESWKRAEKAEAELRGVEAERDALRAQVEAARKWTTESRPCACGHFVLRAMDKAKP